jgi:hypothetical protein
MKRKRSNAFRLRPAERKALTLTPEEERAFLTLPVERWPASMRIGLRPRPKLIRPPAAPPGEGPGGSGGGA